MKSSKILMSHLFSLSWSLWWKKQMELVHPSYRQRRRWDFLSPAPKLGLRGILCYPFDNTCGNIKVWFQWLLESVGNIRSSYSIQMCEKFSWRELLWNCRIRDRVMLWYLCVYSLQQLWHYMPAYLARQHIQPKRNVSEWQKSKNCMEQIV